MRTYYPSPLTIGLLLFCFVASANAATVDLNTWSAESYTAVTGFPIGVWNVAADGSNVYQSANGQPTLFHSDFNAFGTEISGFISVSGSDNDYIGFALGFTPGDSANATADYLLVDWKRGTQFYDFSAPSTTPGTTAPLGLAVSSVTGIPTADEFWGHTDFLSDSSGGLAELTRANTLGSTGWAFNNNYKFTFDFGPNNLDVFVDDILELSISGAFSDGRMAFYNFSQAGVTYSAFTIDEGSYPPSDTPPIPEPSTFILLGTGLAGLAFAVRRRRKE